MLSTIKDGKNMDESLLAPCNVYCGSCAVYKKSRCLGCAEQSRKAAAQGKVFCDIYLCANGKGLAACSDCQDYPCKKYNSGIFAESFIKWIKEKLKEA
jgi:hypothetical protein